ncbi:MAG: capsule assembly Wzi family protein, partial [Odoribacter sp.]|nr:capsule assembly Wzi family protein [Odoribacter sp.]
MKIKCFILVNILLFIFHFSSFSQKRPLRYYGEVGGVPTSDNLPFWLRSNQYGKYEKDTYLWGNFNLTYDFKYTNTKKFDYALGVEGTGALGHDDNKAFINQLFGRIRWQRLVLDIGVIHKPEMYGGLSATNGDMLYSNNSRSMPGISLSTADYIIIPWFKKKLAVRGIYSEYRMNDKRFAGKKTNLHHKMGALKFTPSSRFNIEVGADHYVQWGGEVESHGKLPASFKDYIRVVFFLPGSSDSPSNEADNKLGNHIGSYFLKANYFTTKWDITFNYNHI